MSVRLIATLLQVAFAATTYAAGILSVTSQTGSPVVSIDPATGTVQPLFNTNASAANFGFSAFDPASRRLYFLSGSVGTQQLVIADLNSSTVTTRSIAIPAAYIFFELEGPAVSIPTLSFTLLVVMAGAMAAVGSLMLRRAGS